MTYFLVLSLFFNHFPKIFLLKLILDGFVKPGGQIRIPERLISSLSIPPPFSLSFRPQFFVFGINNF